MLKFNLLDLCEAVESYDIMDNLKKVDSDIEGYGSEVEFEPLDDPDDSNYDSEANRRYRKERSKNIGEYYAVR